MSDQYERLMAAVEAYADVATDTPQGQLDVVKQQAEIDLLVARTRAAVEREARILEAAAVVAQVRFCPKWNNSQPCNSEFNIVSTNDPNRRLWCVFHAAEIELANLLKQREEG